MPDAENVILTELAAAFPMAHPEYVLGAVAEALQRYADLTKVRDPYAKITIRSHEQAAATVNALFRRLTADAEDRA